MIKIEKKKDIMFRFLDRVAFQEMGALVFILITGPSSCEHGIPNPPFPPEEYLKEVMKNYGKVWGRKVTPRFAYFFSLIGSFLDPNMEICDNSAISLRQKPRPLAGWMKAAFL